jgi:uncharacterized protein (TIGR01777 family)
MDKQQTVLIAGATGFVGMELVKYLIDSGYEIKILTRNIDRAKKIFPKGVTLLPWPNEHENRVLPSSYTCHAIINLAGANIGKLRWTQRNKIEIVNSRVKSVDALFGIVTQLPELPNVWIQASAIGYYGANTPMPTNESGLKGEGFLADVVNQWEMALESKSLEGIRKVYLRLGIVISPKGGFLKQMKNAFNLGIGICPGNGLQKMSWIHLEDLVEIIHQSIEKPNCTGIINAVSPNPISYVGFSELLKKKTPALFMLKIPAFVFRLFLGTDKTNEMLLANQEIVPEKLLENSFPYQFQHFEDVFTQ